MEFTFMRYKLLIASITILSIFVFHANAQNNPSKAKTPKINTKKANTKQRTVNRAPAKPNKAAQAKQTKEKDKNPTSPCMVTKTPVKPKSRCSATRSKIKNPCSMRVKRTRRYRTRTNCSSCW